MNNWIKISSEELEKSKEIIGLKKGDLQIQLVKALVRIDRSIDILEKEPYLNKIEDALKILKGDSNE